MKNNLATIPDVSFRLPTESETLKAGKYLVIDPCYVFGEPSSLWDRICNALFPPERGHDGYDKLIATFHVDEGDFDVVMFSTAYGDGCYPVFIRGEEVGSCGVDAGMLCFIPAELIKAIDGSDFLGAWVDLPQTALIEWGGDGSWGRGGDAKVGPIEVCTCGCMMQDEDEDELEDEEDDEEEYFEEEDDEYEDEEDDDLIDDEDEDEEELEDDE